MKVSPHTRDFSRGSIHMLSIDEAIAHARAVAETCEYEKGDGIYERYAYSKCVLRKRG